MEEVELEAEQEKFEDLLPNQQVNETLGSERQAEREEEQIEELEGERKRQTELEAQEESVKHVDRRLALGIIILIVVLGAVVVALDWKEVGRVISEANWLLALPAFGFVVLSYSFLSFGFVLINRAFGIQVSRRELFQISIVTTIINRLLTTGGAAGFGMRILMLQRRGAEVKDIMAATLFHVYVISLGILALLPIGLTYLLLNHGFSAKMSIAIGAVAGLLGFVFLMATLLVLLPALRRWFLVRISGLMERVLHKEIQSTAKEFDESMTRGVKAIQQRPILATGLIGLTSLDWMCSLTTMWFCFQALGVTMGVEVLITGFSIGLTAGALSMLPGGLGMQDLSMAGVYALLGTRFEQAILAAVLFRVVYYLVPYVISLVFYGRLLRYKGQENS